MTSLKHLRHCLHVSVAPYAPHSPLWEVCVFWEGADIDADCARTFGSEKAARAFASRVKSAINEGLGDLFKVARADGDAVAHALATEGTP